MVAARDLYQLQELDTTIEADEKRLQEKLGLLKESQELTDARSKFSAAQQSLADLKKKQRDAEHDIEATSGKIKAAEDKLYSGRIGNPKELMGLNEETALLKKKRDQLETVSLDLMEKLESAAALVSTSERDLKKTEMEWQDQQKGLIGEIDALKSKLADAKQKRQSLAQGIDKPTLDQYSRLRKHKGCAVVRVERGICGGCRISLPFSDVQQARGGSLVHCSSCGRILFLP